jgi:hypothetical protein
MRRSDLGRAPHSPLRIEPERGQVSENSLDPPSKDSCDVLQEDVSGSNLANDPGDMGPEPGARSLDPDPESCVADVGAREARNDEIHRATPRLASEGREIRPNRRTSQSFFFHARSQDLAAEGFDLHVADDASSSARQRDASVESPASGAEAKHSDGTTIHIGHDLLT